MRVLQSTLLKKTSKKFGKHPNKIACCVFQITFSHVFSVHESIIPICVKYCILLFAIDVTSCFVWDSHDSLQV